jgi:hypothetical protein
MAKKKRTKAELDAERERAIANADRLLALAEKAQAELDAKKQQQEP